TLLGARYGAFLVATVGNPSLATHLQSQVGNGIDVNSSGWGLGDTYFQPLWLMWSRPRFDAGMSYGFYAPSGRYKNNSPKNVGFGFWEHQVEGSLRVHFDEEKTFSFVAVPTFNIPMDKTDVDITPGAQFSMNWALRKNFPGGWAQLAAIV